MAILMLIFSWTIVASSLMVIWNPPSPTTTHTSESGFAKFAKPDSEVWVVVGDGGFQMTMSELATIVQEKINIKIAIINNGFLGMVRQWQEFFYDKRYVATPLVAPDFAALANAFGIRGERITKRAEVLPTIRSARESAE